MHSRFVALLFRRLAFQHLEKLTMCVFLSKGRKGEMSLEYKDLPTTLRRVCRIEELKWSKSPSSGLFMIATKKDSSSFTHLNWSSFANRTFFRTIGIKTSRMQCSVLRLTETYWNIQIALFRSWSGLILLLVLTIIPLDAKATTLVRYILASLDSQFVLSS